MLAARCAIDGHDPPLKAVGRNGKSLSVRGHVERRVGVGVATPKNMFTAEPEADRAMELARSVPERFAELVRHPGRARVVKARKRAE